MVRVASRSHLADHNVLVLLLLGEYLGVFEALCRYIHIFFLVLLCDDSEVHLPCTSLALSLLHVIRGVFGQLLDAIVIRDDGEPQRTLFVVVDRALLDSTLGFDVLFGYHREHVLVLLIFVEVENRFLLGIRVN